MHDDIKPRQSEPASGPPSIARRREILKRIGKTSVLAGAAASPLAAMATGTRKWCRHPVDTTKCVQASISGMASVVLSAQTSDEVCAKKCSHYSTSTNWPTSCSNGSITVTCNTPFATTFNCAGGTSDSLGVVRGQSGCLLDKTMLVLCTSHPTTAEAHWATALGNANKLITPPVGAPFPYTPGQVVGHFQDLAVRSSAYSFYTTYCENYA